MLSATELDRLKALAAGPELDEAVCRLVEIEPEAIYAVDRDGDGKIHTYSTDPNDTPFYFEWKNDLEKYLDEQQQAGYLKKARIIIRNKWQAVSTNIEAAWLVVEAIHGRGDCLSLTFKTGVFKEDLNRPGWEAHFRHSDSWAVAPTAPLAICLAAIAAMGGEQ